MRNRLVLMLALLCLLWPLPAAAEEPLTGVLEEIGVTGETATVFEDLTSGLGGEVMATDVTETLRELSPDGAGEALPGEVTGGV
ncbi:hypothetical protein LJC74_09675, partial [Eubacteriales bacterium OttesenSCG-928-A19]|nr:hypothetical protein [Eubacteriales bacterium OttesenSCG-928-A19]